MKHHAEPQDHLSVGDSSQNPLHTLIDGVTLRLSYACERSKVRAQVGLSGPGGLHTDLRGVCAGVVSMWWSLLSGHMQPGEALRFDDILASCC